MKPKHTIQAKELLLDLQSGISFEHLRDKYKMSQSELQYLLRQLLRAGVIEKHELELIPTGFQEGADSQRRGSARSYVFVPLPIFDLKHHLDKGFITEISKCGFRTSGIPVGTGDVREFLIQPDYFADVHPFVFEAQCVWSLTSHNGNIQAGFKITNISQEGLIEMEKIIAMLSIST